MVQRIIKTTIALLTSLLLLSFLLQEVKATNHVEIDSINLKQTPHQIENWTINASYAFNPPTSYVYGNNEYVAVGEYGTVLKSLDGVNWTTLTRFANYQLTSITWNGEHYIMSGANTDYPSDAIYTSAELFISKDAKQWNKVEFGFNDSIQYMEYGKNVIIASGRQGIYSSNDGVNWNKVIDFPESYHFHPLHNINNQFFVTAYEENKLYTSKDGVKWESYKYDIDADIKSFIYVNGQYVGVSDGIYKSPDGIKWTKLQSSPQNIYFRSVTTDGKKVVAMGTGGKLNDQVVFVSENLSSWTEQSLKSFGHQYFVIYPTKDGFAGLAYSEGSSIYSLHSKNGLSWSHKVIGISAYSSFESVTYNGKRAVAVGDQGNIIYSDNGTKWHSANSLSNRAIYGRPTFFAVEYGANKFVATGNNGIYTSSDGVSWNQTKLKSTMLTKLIWTGKYFVAAGQTDGVYTSYDGENWSKVASVSKEGHWLMSMVYDGKRIIGAFQIYNGGNQYIQLMETINGTSWTKLKTLNAIAIELSYNDGTYLAVNPYYVNDLWLSKDTKSWLKTDVTKEIINDDIVSIQSFDGYFVAFNRSLQKIDGEYISNTNYYSSKDGKSWKKHEVPARQAEHIFGEQQINDGIKAFGKYIFVGSQGYILSTPDLNLEDPIYITVEGVTVQQSSEVGKAYIENGVTYLPLRVIGESLKFNIDWNSIEKSVTFKNDNQSVKFTNVQLKNGLSYVPLRKVSEQLGYTVNFKKIDNNNYVDIVKK